jgi:predicted membrane protein
MEKNVFEYNTHTVCYYLAKMPKTKHYSKKTARFFNILAVIGFVSWLTIVGIPFSIFAVVTWLNISEKRQDKLVANCKAKSLRVKNGMDINHVRAIMFGVPVKKEGYFENGKYVIDYYQETGHDGQFEERFCVFDTNGKLVDMDTSYKRIVVTSA